MQNYSGLFTGNSFIEIPHNEDFDFNSNDFSISFMIKVGIQDAAIISKGPSVENGIGWNIQLENSGNHGYGLRVDYNNGITGGNGGENGNLYTDIIYDNLWHIVVINFDRDTGIFVFVDFNLEVFEEIETQESISNNYPLLIGKRGDDWGMLNGLIDNIQLRNYCISLNEMELVLNPNLEIFYEGLIGYWNFNENEGDSLFDLSGNNNHGTIHGATWSSDVPTGCTDPLAINYNEEANFDDGSCEYIDSINLNFGNNLISFRGNPQNPNSQIIAESISNINFILGQGQGLFNTPEGWSGNLTTLDKYSGYWVNVSETQNWTYLLDGEPVDAETNPYNLSYGNNLISYLGQENCPTIDALGNENINFILGQGQGLFNTSEGWSGNLTTLNRGKGYWLNTGSSIEEFHWNTNCSDDGFAKNNYNLPEEFQFVQSTEQAFYLIKEIEEIENGDIITAYCGEQMVGSAIWNGQYTAIPVMGRDVSEQTLGFCESGEKPQFFWNKDPSTSSGGRRKEFGLALSPSKGDIPGFANLGVYTIDKLESVENEISPTEWSLAPAYPNPFNPVTTIEIGVPEIIKTQPVVSLQVFDINGRLIKTLIDGHIEPGFHTVDWDATGYPSGVYFVKMVAGDLSMNSGQGFTQSQKVILMK